MTSTFPASLHRVFNYFFLMLKPTKVVPVTLCNLNLFRYRILFNIQDDSMSGFKFKMFTVGPSRFRVGIFTIGVCSWGPWTLTLG